MDSLKRKLFVKNEIKLYIFRSILKSRLLKTKFKLFILFKIFLLSIFCSQTKQKNRCLISGRSIAVKKKYKLSRFVMREKINNGDLVGFRRFSW